MTQGGGVEGEERVSLKIVSCANAIYSLCTSMSSHTEHGVCICIIIVILLSNGMEVAQLEAFKAHEINKEFARKLELNSSTVTRRRVITGFFFIIYISRSISPSHTPHICRCTKENHHPKKSQCETFLYDTVMQQFYICLCVVIIIYFSSLARLIFSFDFIAISMIGILC